MDLGIAGKRALVCGASAGLGKAIAGALVAEGARVVINSRSEERLREAKAALEAAAGAGVEHAGADVEHAGARLEDTGARAAFAGARVEYVVADLSDPRGPRRAVAGAEKLLGGVDILVTNTGGPPSGPIEDHDAEVWRKAIAQNLESVVGLVRAALPGMKERRWGRIVNVTSVSVKQPVPGLVLSNAIRAGVTGFAKTVANEAAPFNVTVNNVLPGFTRTERLGYLARAVAAREGITEAEAFGRWEAETPMGRLGEPAELAHVAAFLCSEAASYVTGQSVAVDGGWTRGVL